ncbi:hypothetical protein [Burkholderia sp. Ax-1724]|uniref:hypothetical protein n=1 Tax=Burkholderia sp. Ax-1724 TaxID=2608336 RepID=UPI0014229399|nr:hypothetical protein [Burkholderia sp. Ax-1724]NIF50983.1 hypothetical protein [Burkholderia sp. Ax-1724]
MALWNAAAGIGTAVSGPELVEPVQLETGIAGGVERQRLRRGLIDRVAVLVEHEALARQLGDVRDLACTAGNQDVRGRIAVVADAACGSRSADFERAVEIRLGGRAERRAGRVVRIEEADRRIADDADRAQVGAGRIVDLQGFGATGNAVGDLACPAALRQRLRIGFGRHVVDERGAGPRRSANARACIEIRVGDRIGLGAAGLWVVVIAVISAVAERRARCV